MDFLLRFLNYFNFISISYADDIESTPVNLVSSTSSNSTGFGGFFLFLISFFFISALLFYFFYTFTKFNNAKFSGNDSIKVLNRINLDSSLSIFSVKVQDELLLLSKSEGNVTVLKSITDEDKINLFEIDCEKNSKEHQSFQDVILNQISSLTNNNSFDNSSKAKVFSNKR